MLFSYNILLQDTGRRFQRIHGRIDTLLHNLSGEYRGGIQMRKGRCRSRIRQIIGRYIYGLDGSNGTIFRGSDPLLQSAQIGSQCRLVSYCGRHTSKQCRYLGTGLDKTENVINEQQYILVLHITEILCHGKSGLSYPHSGTRGLIHLAEYQRGLF